MELRIFYSWQSDLPGATNRNLILQCLQTVAKNIANDDAVEIEPVIDRDTLGLPGSPDIITAIFHKIKNAAIFVADISLINSESDKRKTPNPNVLIELGYALHCLGHERIIFIFNTAFGNLEQLPFDLRSRRIMTYYAQQESKGRADERKLLERQLNGALRDAFTFIPIESIAPVVNHMIDAIENKDAKRIVLLRRELKILLRRFEELAPPTLHNGGDLAQLTDAIAKSEHIVLDFTKLVEIAVLMNDHGVLLEIYTWFGLLIEKYRRPDDYVGITYDGDYDYFRFVGHELMVTLVGFLLKERSFEFLKNLLDTTIPIAYLYEEYGPGEVHFFNTAEWLHLLNDESEKQNKTSIHSSLLMERHTRGVLAELMPIRDFTSADYFLYLYCKIVISDDATNRYTWRPWSIVYLKEPPLFLKRIERTEGALELAKIFNLSTVEELRTQIEEKTLKVRSFFSRKTLDLFLRSFQFEKIGTKR